MGRKHCGKMRNCTLGALSPFSHSVFKRRVLQRRKNQGLFGKGLRGLNSAHVDGKQYFTRMFSKVSDANLFVLL